MLSFFLEFLKVFVAVSIFFVWVPRYHNIVEEFKTYQYPDWLRDIDFIVFSDKREQQRILSKIDIDQVNLTEKEVDAIVSFLYSLTGKSENNRPLGKPSSVPSGFLVD